MIRGTETHLLPGGPKVSPSEMESIGVFDHSKCWGVWVPAHSDEKQSDHLIVSPNTSGLVAHVV